MAAPFTLRTAISLRRCSQLSVTRENMPKAAISIQTIAIKLSNFISASSDFR